MQPFSEKELVTVAQASQRAVSLDFRHGSISQRNVSEKMASWVLDTRLWAGGLSDFPDLWRWVCGF